MKGIISQVFLKDQAELEALLGSLSVLDTDEAKEKFIEFGFYAVKRGGAKKCRRDLYKITSGNPSRALELLKEEGYIR